MPRQVAGPACWFGPPPPPLRVQRQAAWRQASVPTAPLLPPRPPPFCPAAARSAPQHHPLPNPPPNCARLTRRLCRPRACADRPVVGVGIEDDAVSRTMQGEFFARLGATEHVVLGATAREQDTFVDVALGLRDARTLHPLPPPHRPVDVALIDEHIAQPRRDDPLWGTELVEELRTRGFQGVVCLVTGGSAGRLPWSMRVRVPGVEVAVLKTSLLDEAVVHAVRACHQVLQQRGAPRYEYPGASSVFMNAPSLRGTASGSDAEGANSADSVTVDGFTWTQDEDGELELVIARDGPPLPLVPIFLQTPDSQRRDASRAQAAVHFERVARRRLLHRRFRAYAKLSGRLVVLRAAAAGRVYAPGRTGQRLAANEFEECAARQQDEGGSPPPLRPPTPPSLRPPTTESEEPCS